MFESCGSMRDSFFEMVRERYSIFLKRKQGLPPPWTDNPIFRQNRFCNVFREDDRVTDWFRTNMRNNRSFSGSSASILMTTIAFRWFNKIEIGGVLTDSAIGLQNGKFNSDEARKRISFAYPNGPFVTGAYIVKTPNGMKKLDGVLWCIDQVQEQAEDTADAILQCGSLEKAWEILRQFPFLGDFMSYEVVTDLRHTRLLQGASDVLSWANPGPGAARGAARILYGNPEALSRTSKTDRVQIASEMQTLLLLSKDKAYWPHDRAWEAREAEHGLCEFDKMWRVTQGGRMKQRFNDMERGAFLTK